MPRLKIKTGTVPADDMPFKCPICGKLFVEKKRLERHIPVHDENRIRNYECSVCDRRFFEQCHLDNHMRTHTGERPFKCEDCGKTYTQFSAMNRHRRNTHQNAEQSARAAENGQKKNAKGAKKRRKVKSPTSPVTFSVTGYESSPGPASAAVAALGGVPMTVSGVTITAAGSGSHHAVGGAHEFRTLIGSQHHQIGGQMQIQTHQGTPVGPGAVVTSTGTSSPVVSTAGATIIVTGDGSQALMGHHSSLSSGVTGTSGGNLGIVVGGTSSSRDIKPLVVVSDSGGKITMTDAYNSALLSSPFVRREFTIGTAFPARPRQVHQGVGTPQGQSTVSISSGGGGAGSGSGSENDQQHHNNMGYRPSSFF